VALSAGVLGLFGWAACARPPITPARRYSFRSAFFLRSLGINQRGKTEALGSSLVSSGAFLSALAYRRLPGYVFQVAAFEQECPLLTASSQGVLLPNLAAREVRGESHPSNPTERRYPCAVSLFERPSDLKSPELHDVPKKRLAETRKAKFFGRLHDLTHQWSTTNHSLEYARSPWMSCANDLHGVECSFWAKKLRQDNSGTERF